MVTNDSALPNHTVPGKAWEADYQYFILILSQVTVNCFFSNSCFCVVVFLLNIA